MLLTVQLVIQGYTEAALNLYNWNPLEKHIQFWAFTDYYQNFLF
jgi:hypothetical protein